MKKNMNQSDTTRNEGFTKIPHSVFDGLLLQNLTQRELALLLLVARLSYGCQRRNAVLRQVDLVTIGISAGHAKGVLSSAIAKGVLVQEESDDESGSLFRLADFCGDGTTREVKLRKLVGKQLPRTYQNGNTVVPRVVTDNLPIGEDGSYQIGNSRDVIEGEIVGDGEATSPQPKDSDKHKFIEPVKENVVTGTHVDPSRFSPKNDIEAAALEAWRQLEPHKPDSFGLYLSLIKQGFTADVFYSFASEIKNDPTVRRKGAVFNKKAYEYCRQLLVYKVGTHA